MLDVTFSHNVLFRHFTFRVAMSLLAAVLAGIGTRGAAAAEGPRANIRLESADAADDVFKDDIVAVKAVLRASGFEAGHPVKIRLMDSISGMPLHDANGEAAEKTIAVADSNPIAVELLFRAEQTGRQKIVVEAVAQLGEASERENIRDLEVYVADQTIAVLYIEGYPRWEYRYVKNTLLRDKTINVSCILTGADAGTQQPHTDLAARGREAKYRFFPFAEFPKSIEQLMECDVVLLGDVDPRQFTDAQLRMLAEFVSKKGGGLGMIAGPQSSPAAWAKTPIGPVLPVNIVGAEKGWPKEAIVDSYHLAVTKQGTASPIFRFFADPDINAKYLATDLQPLFWYCPGVTAKLGTHVLAEHPTAKGAGPDAGKVPLLVTGRFGAGRTLFAGYDESWRWRFYTGGSIFDTYWIEQLRYLSAGRAFLRDIRFAADKSVYRLGTTIHLSARVPDPEMLPKTADGTIEIQLVDLATQAIIRTEKLRQMADDPDRYIGSFRASRSGHYKLIMSDKALGHAARDVEIEVVGASR